MRMETTNPKLFATLHPSRDRKRMEKAFESRARALDDIRAAGMQVGTGGMIGLPGQTLEDLCADIRFYAAHDVDMLGMGPYITSLGADMVADGMMEKRALMQLSLNMLAVTRLVLRDVNLAASTALQTLFEDGRERGVSYGANIVMPNVSPREVRKNYQLYDDKPCVDEERDDCRGCLEGRVATVGRRVGWNEWGCSPHYPRRTAARPERRRSGRNASPLPPGPRLRRGARRRGPGGRGASRQMVATHVHCAGPVGVSPRKGPVLRGC